MLNFYFSRQMISEDDYRRSIEYVETNRADSSSAQ